MAHSAIVTFTARPLEEILADGGSRDWRLDPERARQAEYLVCTQNRHNQSFRSPHAPHGSAFLVARVKAVVPSWERRERWLIEISDYTVPEPPIPNIWGKYGNLRYPVWYTTLEELGINLDDLPPFTPLRTAGRPGMAEAAARPPVPPLLRQPEVRPDQVASHRMDSILAQLDRIPDAPAPFDPLPWDEHGLPQ